MPLPLRLDYVLETLARTDPGRPRDLRSAADPAPPEAGAPPARPGEHALDGARGVTVGG